MAQLRGSQHYIWSLGDMLGQGATGAVYKARNKSTGELYAVKTFNQMSYLRSPTVREREFEVLQRLNHENIVRLLAIEEESPSRSPILVMELCTGGSLYNQLDDPENAYGLEEKEFQRVLVDVASGMKHLRDHDIVHRDIKPGNIMRYVNENGRSIYKLIDFGAARELQDQEEFMSLYGTEEYLYPDMYERAVLKRSTGKQFNAMVDLWSLGVTLYHVATGQLPFRPYGGRKNKDTMYQITSKKASGVVSGVQHSDGGPIEWSRNLPSTCRLSHGMKQLITPVLARLLESDQEKMMKFEEFFAAVEVIRKKHLIYVFDLSKNSLLYIYINKEEHLARFQEHIAEQTDIRTQDQHLLFENHDFEKIIAPLQSVSTYPQTSTQNPIYLFSSVHCVTPMPATCTIPHMPSFTSEVSLDNDASLAKNCCALVHFIRRFVGDIICKQQLINKGAKMFLLVLSREIEHNKDLVVMFISRVEEVGKRLQLLADSSSLLAGALTKMIKTGTNEDKQKQYLDNLKNSLQWSSISNQQDSFNKLRQTVDQMKIDIESLGKNILTTEALSWLDNSGCTSSETCILKVDVITSAMKQAVADFQRDRTLKKLSFNEEQIHKFDKHKMKGNCTRAMTLVQDDCYPNTRKMFEQFHSWYSQVWEVQQKLQNLKNKVINVSELQVLLTDVLNQTQESRRAKLKPLLDDFEIDVESSGIAGVSKVECPTSPGNFGFILRTRHDKEIQDLVKILKERSKSNSSLALDIKKAVEESGKYIQNLQQRHIEVDEPRNTSPNMQNEDPMTLTEN